VSLGDGTDLDRIVGVRLPRSRAAWGGATRRTCYELRSQLMASCQIEADGSGSFEAVTARSVFERVLPCPVVAYDIGSEVWLRFVLSGQPFAFDFGESGDLDEIRSDLESPYFVGSRRGSQTSETLVRAAFGDVRPRSFDWSLVQASREELGPLVRSEADGLRRRQDDWLDEFGYRALELTAVSGVMAPQFAALRRRDFPAEARAISPDDLREDMARDARTLTVVPDGVESILQVARLLWLHGWEEWQFLTTAAHYSTLALEASLRMAFDRSVGDKPEISGQRDGLPVTGESVVGYENIRRAARELQNVTVNGRPFPRSKPALTSFLVTSGVLTRWEAKRVEHLVWLRDYYSHPDFALVNWIGQARQTIHDCVLHINITWGRLADASKELS
jgi:hypothetical protein